MRGALFTGSSVMANVCATLVSTPPLSVPPLSCATTVTVAVPLASGAGVKVSVPSAAMAGWLLKRPLLLLTTRNATVWAASPGGPARMFVAKFSVLLAPEFS